MLGFVGSCDELSGSFHILERLGLLPPVVRKEVSGLGSSAVIILAFDSMSSVRLWVRVDGCTKIRGTRPSAQNSEAEDSKLFRPSHETLAQGTVGARNSHPPPRNIPIFCEISS